MKRLMGILFLALSADAMSFVSGDLITCHYALSNTTFEIKIHDVGDEEASVRIFNGQRLAKFYRPALVEFDEHAKGATFILLDQQRDVETIINIDENVELKGKGQGILHFGEDSSRMICKLMR